MASRCCCRVSSTRIITSGCRPSSSAYPTQRSSFGSRPVSRCATASPITTRSIHVSRWWPQARPRLSTCTVGFLATPDRPRRRPNPSFAPTKISACGFHTAMRCASRTISSTRPTSNSGPACPPMFSRFSLSISPVFRCRRERPSRSSIIFAPSTRARSNPARALEPAMVHRRGARHAGRERRET